MIAKENEARSNWLTLEQLRERGKTPRPFDFTEPVMLPGGYASVEEMRREQAKDAQFERDFHAAHDARNARSR